MYCPNCGKEITGSANFCPSCGQKLTDSTTALVESSKLVSVSDSDQKYGLILVDEGDCEKSVVGDLLEDVFGYSSSEADRLVAKAPVEIATGLTEEEAAVVAQMFAEYGIEVSIHDEDEKLVDLSSKAVKSVFNTDGTLIASAVAVIASLTALNRVSSYKRYKKPSLLERIFRPLFTPAKPTHVRRVRPKIEREPEPVMSRNAGFRYRNSGEHVMRRDTGHKGGPDGRIGRGPGGRR